MVRGVGHAAEEAVRGGQLAQLEPDRQTHDQRLRTAPQERQTVPRTVSIMGSQVREPHQHRYGQGGVEHRGGDDAHTVPQRHRQQVVPHRPENTRQVQPL